MDEEKEITLRIRWIEAVKGEDGGRFIGGENFNILFYQMEPTYEIIRNAIG